MQAYCHSNSVHGNHLTIKLRAVVTLCDGNLILKDNFNFLLCSHQGIIDINRNGNSANFFSYVCNGKKSCLPLL